MLSLRISLLRGIVPLLALAMAGCGSGTPSLVEVSGTLTYKGKAVPNALVNFLPENGRMSSGTTDENGHFKLNYDKGHDGALVGKHKVFVTQRQGGAAPGTEPGKSRPSSREWAELFDKYGAEKSKVEIQIDKSTNDLKLEWD
jgi:hypothetical protein